MLSTKIHLLAYSAAGLFAAIEQKNPLLVFSFITEGLAAIFKLGNIYLFRGIATGVDGMVAGIKDKDKRSHYQSYTEGWQHSIQVIKNVFKDWLNKFITRPTELFKMNSDDLTIVSSGIAALGGIFGMSIHEKAGASVRDLAGVGGDYGLYKMDSPNASKAGFLQLAGSILDFSARIFNKSIAKFLGIKNSEAFGKLKDAFMEAAIAFDKLGQLYILKYNQEDDQTLQATPTSKLKTEKDVINKQTQLHTAMAV